MAKNILTEVKNKNSKVGKIIDVISRYNNYLKEIIIENDISYDSYNVMNDVIKKIEMLCVQCKCIVKTDRFDCHNNEMANKEADFGENKRIDGEVTVTGCKSSTVNGDINISMEEAFERIFAENRITKRQQEIIKEIMKGVEVKEISSTLGISVRTVTNHIQDIYTKLKINNKIEMIIFFYKHIHTRIINFMTKDDLSNLT
jgi:DNA-binding CsgD family transcriptional regulator